jgi:hypothetical protein
MHYNIVKNQTFPRSFLNNINIGINLRKAALDAFMLNFRKEWGIFKLRIRKLGSLLAQKYILFLRVIFPIFIKSIPK